MFLFPASALSKHCTALRLEQPHKCLASGALSAHFVAIMHAVLLLNNWTAVPCGEASVCYNVCCSKGGWLSKGSDSEDEDEHTDSSGLPSAVENPIKFLIHQQLEIFAADKTVTPYNSHLSPSILPNLTYDNWWGWPSTDGCETSGVAYVSSEQSTQSCYICGKCISARLKCILARKM